MVCGVAVKNTNDIESSSPGHLHSSNANPKDIGTERIRTKQALTCSGNTEWLLPPAGSMHKNPLARPGSGLLMKSPVGCSIGDVQGGTLLYDGE